MSRYLKFAVPALIIFMLGLVSLFPLRMATVMSKPAGFGYQRVEGTVWNGMFHYPRIGGQEARALGVSLSPGALLTGSIETGFRLSGEDVSGSGTLALSGDDIRLREAGIDITVDRRAGFARFRGSLYLSIDRLHITDHGCDGVEGVFRTDLAAALRSLDLWSAKENDGTLTCDNGRIIVAMTDGEGDEMRRLSFSFDPLQMRLDTDISVRTASKEMRDRLVQAGFRKRNNSWVWHHQERVG